jgi:hypothetical protein
VSFVQQALLRHSKEELRTLRETFVDLSANGAKVLRCSASTTALTAFCQATALLVAPRQQHAHAAFTQHWSRLRSLHGGVVLL